MKNIWIVGKHGLLANAFCTFLEREGIPFISTSREEVDITKKKEIDAFINRHDLSHIINCAAYTNVERAEEEKEIAFLLNQTAVHHLASSCFEKKLKLVHFSTDYVFSGKKLRSYLETDTTEALNIYGQSKLAGEKEALSILKDALVIRISWLFGRDGTSFVSKMKELMLTQTELRIIDDQIGRVSFAEDVARATLSILDQSGIFHFANKGILSWYEFAIEIQKQLLSKDLLLACRNIYPVKTSTYSQKAVRPLFSVLDTTKIENSLDYQLCGYKDALRRCLESL